MKKYLLTLTLILLSLITYSQNPIRLTAKTLRINTINEDGKTWKGWTEEFETTINAEIDTVQKNITLHLSPDDIFQIYDMEVKKDLKRQAILNTYFCTNLDETECVIQYIIYQNIKRSRLVIIYSNMLASYELQQ